MSIRGRRPVLLLVVNQAWNLVNYRAGLIHALQAAGYDIVAVAPPEPKMEERLAAMGVRFIAIPLSARSLSPLGEARLFFALLRIVQRTGPAALLTWTIKSNLWGGLAGRLCGVPVIANISGRGIAHSGSRLLAAVANTLYRLCLARASTVFMQNEHDRAAFVEQGLVRDEQVVPLPGSGVDLERFAPPDHERPTSRQYVLLARLLGAKGVREFVAAARHIRNDRDDLEFALAGFVDPHNPDAIQRSELAEWEAADIVSYVGAVEDVRPILFDAEAVVLPSYYAEGLSRALLEAAAAGRPIITTDHPGCREAVDPEETGFLCEPKDARSLETAIRRLADCDETRWTAISKAARRKAEAEFSERFVIDCYLSALSHTERTISNRSRSPSS